VVVVRVTAVVTMSPVFILSRLKIAELAFEFPWSDARW
jgi:hypothetical protein